MNGGEPESIIRENQRGRHPLEQTPRRRGRPKKTDAEKKAARAGRFTIEVSDPRGELKELWTRCEARVNKKLEARLKQASDTFPDLSFTGPENTNTNTLRDVMEFYLAIS